MKLQHYILGVLTLAMLSISCQKEGENVLSFTPFLELESINKDIITEFEDSVIIYVNFEDGDGDLGRQDPDSNSLYIKDSRLANAEYYHIPPITPDDEKLQTIGKFRVFIPTLFVIGSESREKATISIRVKDQSGKWSNEITTPEITILKQ
jgi:hypothetical protein